MTYTIAKLRIIAAATLLAVLTASAHASDVSLDDITVKSGASQRTITIKHVEAKGSSLSADDLRKLLSGELAPADAKAMAASFSADSLSAPEIDIKSDGGTTTIHNIAASGIVAGYVAKFDIAGADFVGTKPGAAGHAGALHGEGLILEELVAAAQKGAGCGCGRSTLLTFEGADLQIPVGGAVGGGPSDGLAHVVVGPISISGSYDGDFPIKIELDVNGVTVNFSPNSEAAARLKAFGYDTFEISAKSLIACDKSALTCDLSLTLTSPNAATLTLSGDVGNVPKDYRRADTNVAGTQTLTNGQVNLINSGLIDKILDFAAKQRKTDAASLKASLTQMTVMLPLLLGDIETGKRVSAAINAFLADPKNLTVSVKAKGAPVSFGEIAAFRRPADALAHFTLDAKADQ